MTIPKSDGNAKKEMHSKKWTNLEFKEIKQPRIDVCVMHVQTMHTKKATIYCKAQSPKKTR